MTGSNRRSFLRSSAAAVAVLAGSFGLVARVTGAQTDTAAVNGQLQPGRSVATDQAPTYLWPAAVAQPMR